VPPQNPATERLVQSRKHLATFGSGRYNTSILIAAMQHGTLRGMSRRYSCGVGFLPSLYEVFELFGKNEVVDILTLEPLKPCS
jgi:hypothetical protein